MIPWKRPGPTLPDGTELRPLQLCTFADGVEGIKSAHSILQLGRGDAPWLAIIVAAPVGEGGALRYVRAAGVKEGERGHPTMLEAVEYLAASEARRGAQEDAAALGLLLQEKVAAMNAFVSANV